MLISILLRLGTEHPRLQCMSSFAQGSVVVRPLLDFASFGFVFIVPFTKTKLVDSQVMHITLPFLATVSTAGRTDVVGAGKRGEHISISPVRMELRRNWSAVVVMNHRLWGWIRAHERMTMVC